MRAIIEEVAAIIGKALMDAGGRENGYMTYAAGNVGPITQIVRISVPQPEGVGATTWYSALAVKKHRLIHDIKRALPEEFFSLYSALRIEDEYIGDGCYRTWVYGKCWEEEVDLHSRAELPGFEENPG